VVAAVGILLILKTILIAGPGGVDPSLMPWRVLLSYSEPILLGVLLASAMNCRRLYPAFSVLARNRGTIAFMLGLVVAFMLWGELDDKSSAQSLVFYVICTLLVGVAAVSDKLPLLGGTAMSWIGLLSYGIYLMHMPVLSVIKKFTLNPAAVLVMTILAVLPAAWFSFRFFEEPIRRLGRAPRIVRKRARVVAQQARG
jgi:peptidoglycan/LPS O-acetylase OafA/YrhL